MTLTTHVIVTPDWKDTTSVSDDYLAGKIKDTISPFVNADGLCGMLIVTTA